MKITEVRVKLIEDSSERLKAFCSITFNDCFVIRDLKIIDGSNGPFVAMPSRKLTAHCPRCHCKNHVRADFWNQCGAKLPEATLVRDEDGRAKLYADIAHPINSDCREMIQQKVIEAYEAEKILAAQPDYVCRYDDFDYVYNPDSRANEAFAATSASVKDEEAASNSFQASSVRTEVLSAYKSDFKAEGKPTLVSERKAESLIEKTTIERDQFGAGIFSENERIVENE